MTPSIYDWSTTEANNATADSGINWQEGQLPSTVNNSARYMMRRGKELLNDLGAIATAGGTANAITVTASSPFSAYTKGIRLLFKAASTNSAAATLNVNSIGAKAIVTLEGGAEQAIGPGAISAAGLFEVIYDTALQSGAGAWILLKPASKAYAVKNANYTVLPGDNGAVHRYTAAATASLTAAATLGPSWTHTIIADGGAVTIDPNASETINGALTLVVPSGETAQIICDGANFFMIIKPMPWETIGDYSLAGVASLDITNLSAFRKIRATGHLYPSTTSAVNLVTSSNNGSTYDTGASDYNSQIMQSQGATLTGFSGNAAFIGISGGVGVSNTVDDGIQFEFTLDNFNKASRMKYVSKCFFIGVSGNYASTIGAQRLQATARNALRIIAASGTLSGTVLVEGVRG